MEIYVKMHKTIGNDLLEENRLPRFRERIENKELVGTALLESERKMYGYQTGERVLPYMLQDVYSRDRKEIIQKTIVMENKYIKATFLPEYGMRLYSLFDKEENKELLYVNPILQFGNLAIRGAWFSGGVEWNIAQLGHTFTTCDNMYAAEVTDPSGEKFLRCYEYERCKGIYWQIDFHLEEEAKQLRAYVRMINPKDESVPFYWWTNIAVPEEKNVRVFSGNKNVIYLQPETNEKIGAIKGMAHGQMPFIPAVPEEDASYPEPIPFSSEYFFQNEQKESETWEAAVYDDGHAFFERSSSRLQYRKMFCWGNHEGGKHWKDYLSDKGKGNYVELQGGFAPTQVHGLDIPANTTWDFVQIFGGLSVNPDEAYGDWEEGQKYIHGLVDEIVSEDEVLALLDKYRNTADDDKLKLLHLGNGYGALEEIRNPGATPKGFEFPEIAIGSKEEVWLNLLQNEEMPELPINELPGSFMVDPRYESYIERATEKGGYTAYNMLGILQYESKRTDDAVKSFEESNRIKENPLAYRNLFQIYKDEEPEKALEYMEKAISLLGDNVIREYVEEYTAFLGDHKEFEKLWKYYRSLPENFQKMERITLNVMEAAVHMHEIEFLEKQFNKSFAVIREGERGYTESYFAYQALMESKETGVPFNQELIKKYVDKNDIPTEIDFRLARV